MKLNRTPNPLDRNARNGENDNWDIIEGETRKINDKVDNFLNTLSEDAFNKVVDDIRLNWSHKVNNFADLPTNPKKGDTVAVENDDMIYRYDGSNWIAIIPFTQFSAIAEIDNRLSSQLAETSNRGINAKFNYPDIKLMAHRGLSGIYPENTSIAFEQAGVRGFWGCECDIQLTKDKRWVVMHDKGVSRTTDGTGLVSDYTLTEIKELNITGGNNVALYPNLKIPTLEEFLSICKKWSMKAIIEVKDVNVGVADITNLINILKDYSMVEQTILQGYGSNLITIRSVNKEVTIGALVAPTENNLDIVEQYEDVIVLINKSEVTNINRIHNRGLKAGVWTVNTPAEYLSCVENNANFIFTDYILGG